jgi:hypothetical protein
MEQRREERVESDHAAWVTIYGKADIRIPGWVRNRSGRGIGIEVGQAVGSGSALKIEFADSLLLGEAIYCRAEGQCFYVGVEIDQAVNGLIALGRSVRDFAGGMSGAEHAHAVHDTDRQNQKQSR